MLRSREKPGVTAEVVLPRASEEIGRKKGAGKEGRGGGEEGVRM